MPVAVVVLALWSSIVPVAFAADSIVSDPEGLLERPIVDVAIVDRGRGDRTLDLLTLDVSEAAPGQARVALLHRDDVWSLAAEASVTMSSEGDGGTQFLVDLGGGRFALIAASWTVRSTTVVPVAVDSTSATGALRLGAAVTLDLAVTGAAAADVDGDRVPELVIAGETGDGSEPCPPTGLAVLSGEDALTVLAQGRLTPEGSSAAMAAVGRWDDRPGADLLAQVFDCDPEGPGMPQLLAVGLEDLTAIADRVMISAASPSIGPGAPLVVDADGDGRDEAVVISGSSLYVIDPADEWRTVYIDGTVVAPLTVSSRTYGPPSALSAWLGSGPVVGSARIVRVDGALKIETSTAQPLTDVAFGNAQRLITVLRTVAEYRQPPPIMVADVDADGCTDLVVPGFVAPCDGTARVRDGPDFRISRPLALFGHAGDRRLLVAEGLDWYPSEEGSLIPSPAAAAPSVWRQAQGMRFYLADLAASALSSSPVPATPVVGTNVSPAGAIDIEAPTGARLLVRVQALGPTDSAPSGPLSDTDDFFLRRQRDTELVTTLRIPIPAGSIPGASTGSMPLDVLRDAQRLDGTLADRWVVSVVNLDALGVASSPVRVTAIHDVTAPKVSLDASFLSAPWPFEATITGTSEAGASVRAGGGGLVTVGQTGAFGVTTQLAPWPQTIEVTAVDPSGNATVTRISVMGGLDLRQLPWATIGAVGVLLAVGASSIVGGRRVRNDVTVAAVDAHDLRVRAAVVRDDDHLPDIEDLGERPIGRRR